MVVVYFLTFFFVVVAYNAKSSALEDETVVYLKEKAKRIR